MIVATQEELKKMGVNCIEFTVGLSTCGSFIYSKLSTNQLGKLTIGKSTVRNVSELDMYVSMR